MHSRVPSTSLTDLLWAQPPQHSRTSSLNFSLSDVQDGLALLANAAHQQDEIDAIPVPTNSDDLLAAIEEEPVPRVKRRRVQSEASSDNERLSKHRLVDSRRRNRESEALSRLRGITHPGDLRPRLGQLL